MTENYLPSQVRSMVDELLKVTGEPAVVTRTGSSYLVEHGNDRVRLACFYARNSRGRFSYSSTLSVDGVPRERVQGADSYARLLADPDETHPNRRTGVELPPVHPLDGDETVPALVLAIADTVRAKNTVTTVAVGHCSMAQRGRHSAWTYDLNEKDEVADPLAYVVEMVKVNGDRVQIHFQPHPKNGDVYYASGTSGVDDQGRDLMGEFSHDMHRALELLLEIRLPRNSAADSGVPRPRGSSKGEASNSVMVRKSTVFRI